jgi:hypothetical protein
MKKMISTRNDKNAKRLHLFVVRTGVRCGARKR